MIFKKKFLVLAFIVILFIGCVYYNTFFNALKYFDEAQSQPLNDKGRPTSAAIQNYNKTIKRCGLVLTEYKDSKWADDALFLLARAMYYKGTNQIQALEKFEDLVNFYPQSEHIPQAKIYIAKTNHKLKKEKEAYKLLQEYLTDPEFKDLHSSIYLILANYHLEDEDFIQTEYFLQKIIDKYPKSEEYETAFFDLGKTYHISEDYEKSNEVFFDLLKSKVSKKNKLEARFFIANNYLLLNDFDTSYEYIKKLLKDEYRQENITKIQLLEARCLVKLGRIDEASELFDVITKDNKRTEISAEAYFYLGEMHFNVTRDYEKAIEHYNFVKSEFSRSEFVELALSRSSVASQIIQYYHPDSNISAEELIEQQYKLAEYYLEILELPDSALVVYDNIINQDEALELQIDSLNYRIEILTLELDSLSSLDSLTFIPSVSDSIIVSDSLKVAVPNDTLAISDSLFLLDSLKVSVPNDTLAISDSLFLLDSLKVSVPNDTLALSDSLFINEKEVQLESLKSQVLKTEETLNKYIEEFIPFAKFTKIWVYKNIFQDSVKCWELFTQLQQDNPQNKYTESAFILLNEIEIEIEEENLHETEYDLAIKNYETNPSETIEKLILISANPDHEFSEKATSSIGYILFIILSDSTAAKPYFNTLLENAPNSIFSIAIRKFYDGTNYLKVDRLSFFEELERAQEEAEKEAEEEMKEETEKETEETKEKIEKEENPEIEKEEKPDSEEIKPENEKYDTLPEIIRKFNPVSPSTEPFIEDGILLKVEVLEDATVGEIIVIKSLMSGPGGLDELAIDAVNQWEFKPAQKDGKPVSGWITITVTFERK